MLSLPTVSGSDTVGFSWSSPITHQTPTISSLPITPTEPSAHRSVPIPTGTAETLLPTVPDVSPAPSTADSCSSQLSQSAAVPSMGQCMGGCRSHPTRRDSHSSSEKVTGKESWRQTLKVGFGIRTTAVAAAPEDNVFVPIQGDNILPQIPIGRHHPVPRKGIEDDEDTTLHTNKFYANAFLGNQDQPIWTQPYSLWWGKGLTQQGQFPTWGMNIGHVEEDEVVMPPENPPQVRQVTRVDVATNQTSST